MDTWIQIGRKAQFDATAGVIALDVPKLLETVGSMTAYGANVTLDEKALDGVLVIQGTPDLRKIAEGLLVQATVTHPGNLIELKDFSFPAYALMEKKGAQSQRLFIAFPPEPVILISKSKPQIIKARDVFRGEAASVAKTPDSALGRLLRDSKGAYFFGGSMVPSGNLFPGNAPQARILQLASSGALALGENGPNTFAHGALVARSEEMAVKLTKILQGLAAMLSLGESNDKQLAEFLNSVAVTKKDDTVTLDLSYPSARILQMVNALQPDTKPARVAAPQPPSAKVLAKWNAEPPVATAATALAWHTIENVRLVNGATLSLVTQLNGGSPGHLDRVEITPTGTPGAPLVFRAEYMKLSGYDTEGSPFGGKWISARRPNNNAQFQFPGADDLYTVRIGYLGAADGKASYSLTLKEPTGPKNDQ